MKKHKPIVRLIALVLSGAFFAQELSYATPVSMESVVGATHASPLQAIVQDPTRFEAPLDFVTMKEIHVPPGGNSQDRPFIIHIQDAHSNLSGQESLAGALDQIMSRYGVSLVLSEGGAQDCSLTSVKKIAPPEVWKKLAKSYLVQGKITGEEYLNLVSDHPMKIMGLEDIALYLKSVQNYAELADKREAILDYLKAIQRALDKLKARMYPKELLEYERSSQYSVVSSQGKERQIESFEKLLELANDRKVDLNELPNILKLIELKLKEKLINFDLTNLEQAALIQELEEKGEREKVKGYLEKMGQMKNQKVSQFSYFQNILNIAKEKNVLLTKYPNLLAYGEYLKNFSDLDLDQVLGELERLEDRVYKRMLHGDSTGDAGGESSSRRRQDPSRTSHDARLVRSIDRYLKLLDVAYRIQMSTKEFNLFVANEPDFGTVNYLAFINRKLAELGYFGDLIPYKNLLEEGKKYLEAFYDSVSKRDVAFIQNTERILKEEKQQVAVLITGGYHTPHLKKLFREKGYSVAVLTPIVTSETNQKNYEKQLLSPIKPEVKKVEIVQGEDHQDKSLSTLSSPSFRGRQRSSADEKSQHDGVRQALLRISQGLDIKSADVPMLAYAREVFGNRFEEFLMDAARYTVQARHRGKKLDQDEIDKEAIKLIDTFNSQTKSTVLSPTFIGRIREVQPTAKKAAARMASQTNVNRRQLLGLGTRPSSQEVPGPVFNPIISRRTFIQALGVSGVYYLTRGVVWAEDQEKKNVFIFFNPHTHTEDFEKAESELQNFIDTEIQKGKKVMLLMESVTDLDTGLKKILDLLKEQRDTVEGEKFQDLYDFFGEALPKDADELKSSILKNEEFFRKHELLFTAILQKFNKKVTDSYNNPEFVKEFEKSRFPDFEDALNLFVKKNVRWIENGKLRIELEDFSDFMDWFHFLIDYNRYRSTFRPEGLFDYDSKGKLLDQTTDPQYGSKEAQAVLEAAKTTAERYLALMRKRDEKVAQSVNKLEGASVAGFRGTFHTFRLARALSDLGVDFKANVQGSLSFERLDKVDKQALFDLVSSHEHHPTALVEFRELLGENLTGRQLQIYPALDVFYDLVEKIVDGSNRLGRGFFDSWVSQAERKKIRGLIFEQARILAEKEGNSEPLLEILRKIHVAYVQALLLSKEKKLTFDASFHRLMAIVYGLDEAKILSKDEVLRLLLTKQAQIDFRKWYQMMSDYRAGRKTGAARLATPEAKPDAARMAAVTPGLVHCVTGDTLLPTARMMDNGSWMVDKLAPIKDVRAGGYVLSLNEETQTIEPHRIKGLLDMGVKPVYKLTTKSGRSIKTTANHPYLVRTPSPSFRARQSTVAGEKSHSSIARSLGTEAPRDDGADAQWIKVSELKAGDEIGVPADLSFSVSVFPRVHTVNHDVRDLDVKADSIFSDSQTMRRGREINQRLGEIEDVSPGNVELDFFQNAPTDCFREFVKFALAAAIEFDLIGFRTVQAIPNLCLILDRGIKPDFLASSIFFLSLAVNFGLSGRCASMASISHPTGLWSKYSSLEAVFSNRSSKTHNRSQNEYVSNTKPRGEPFLSVRTAAVNSLGKARPVFLFLSSLGTASNLFRGVSFRSSLPDSFTREVDFIVSSFLNSRSKYNMPALSLSSLLVPDVVS